MENEEELKVFHGKPGPGRPKGSKSRRTEEWERFADYFMQEGIERLRTEMAALEGKDFIATMKDLMEYFQPKLARNEVTGKDGTPFLPKQIMDVRKNNCHGKDCKHVEENTCSAGGDICIENSVDNSVPDSTGPGGQGTDAN